MPHDRQHPEGASIKIYFELYLHINPGPAESAILFNTGGPGVGTTSVMRAIVFALFVQNLDVHDFLLIDDRGRGQSAVINCPELQHGTAPFWVAESDCAAQLGIDDSRYGTGDVAMDTDAVRAALGYDKVDYWGASYGGQDVAAYATRFGKHLRSIVLDAPEGTPSLRAFLLDGNEAQSTARVVRLDCNRSPTCSPITPIPTATFVSSLRPFGRNRCRESLTMLTAIPFLSNWTRLRCCTWQSPKPVIPSPSARARSWRQVALSHRAMLLRYSGWMRRSLF